MKVIEWLFSIEDKVVWHVGSLSLIDLRLVLMGFTSATRFIYGVIEDPFYPEFQRYIEAEYDLIDKTSKSWARIIMANSENDAEAMKTFYRHLRAFARQKGYIQ